MQPKQHYKVIGTFNPKTNDIVPSMIITLEELRIHGPHWLAVRESPIGLMNEGYWDVNGNHTWDYEESIGE